MDLIETIGGLRHPWEKSRAAFFTSVITRALGDRAPLTVLDCGAGDAYFSANLASAIAPRTITCWDASYDDRTIAHLKDRYVDSARGKLSFTRTMPSASFDLVLMLDVIEHVEDDVGFVRSVVETCAKKTASILVSVPAWNTLFSQHDEFLRHHRRYAPSECERVLRAADLEIVECGGLFHSLLLPRAATVARERIERAAGRVRPLEGTAAASWTGGVVTTSIVDAALRADNAVSRIAARAGLKLPGLSYWALARRRA